MDGREIRDQVSRIQPKKNFSKKYVNHLKTDDWKEMRLRILERDKHLCRGCLKAKAIEVHHVTYQNLETEFAFELMSLCKTCHDRYHLRKDNLKLDAEFNRPQVTDSIIPKIEQPGCRSYRYDYVRKPPSSVSCRS